MDSSTRLDCALFRLTPTRTRCDLVLFRGGKSEKLASGLFEPFISHLGFAKDQISKGGYSIKLCPPATDTTWFTKATFERFVRFVSTPAILERFVSLEREILHIESSVQASEFANTNAAGQPEEGRGLAVNGTKSKPTDSSKFKAEPESPDDVAEEENSKVQLQRLLETRKALLRKEQAMAYARGFVAGFDTDNVDDLISFADAFKASRLREACIKFKELCQKKHSDRLWMAELAAVEACSPSELSLMGTSGIILTNAINNPNQNIMLNFSKTEIAQNGSADASKSDTTTSLASSDGQKDGNLPASDHIQSANAKVQVPMLWPNQVPHYMYNFQGPIQQLPPFQGYPFPPMQSVPPQYLSNMQWPQNQKSTSGNREKFLNKKEEDSGEDKQTESDDSDSGSDSDSYTEKERKHSSVENSHRKKYKKKPSRAVVIRNINYITPQGRNGELEGDSDGNSSGLDEFIDEDSLKQNVNDAVKSLKKSHKSKSSYSKKTEAEDSHNAANGSNDCDNDVVANPSGGGKRNETWAAFQNLLMRDEDQTDNGVERLLSMDLQDSSNADVSRAIIHSMDLESEKGPNELPVLGDSFVITRRNGGTEGRVKLVDFENGENVRPVLRVGDCADDLLVSRRLEESGSELGGISSHCASERSVIRSRKGDDCFVVNHSGKAVNGDATTEQKLFDSDCIFASQRDSQQTEKSRKNTFVDDSIMVQARSSVDDQCDSQWKTDISMIVDQTSASHAENGIGDASQDKHNAFEPDDLYMVLERGSGANSASIYWSMDYGIEISLAEVERKCSGYEYNNNADKTLPANYKSTVTKNCEVPGRKDPNKEAGTKVLRGSLRKSNSSEIMSRSRKQSLVNKPIIQKSKFEKEEETRKKMEKLRIERQKRIAERTAAMDSSALIASKKAPSESKSSINYDTNRGIITRETNRIGNVKIRAT